MEVWKAMQLSVERGIDHEGALPGPLKLPRKGPIYYVKASGYKQSLQSRALVYAYALSVSEENASGGTIVTAPTCGSCGVLPAVFEGAGRDCKAEGNCRARNDRRQGAFGRRSFAQNG